MPAPGFITDQALLDQLQATLQLATVDAQSGWPRKVRAANLSAYGTILRALMRRGYDRAQADQWDDGPEFQADIGLWFAIVRGGLAADYDPKYLQLFDRRKELETATVTVGGVVLKPVFTATASGPLDTAPDLFALSDDDLQKWYRALEGPPVPPNPRW